MLREYRRLGVVSDERPASVIARDTCGQMHPSRFEFENILMIEIGHFLLCDWQRWQGRDGSGQAFGVTVKENGEDV